MQRQTRGAIFLIGLLAFVALLGSLAPARARRGLQSDETPVAYVYLPFIESDVTSNEDTPTPGTPTPTFTPTSTPVTRTPTRTFTPGTRTYTPSRTPGTPTPTQTPGARTPTFTRTPTPTSTAYPALPTLIAPVSDAILTQPVGSNEWLFQWSTRMGPCYSSLSANGPNGYSINALVNYQTSSPGPYSYHFTRTVPFPVAAFGLWTWRATVICPLGSAQSESRTFYLEDTAPSPP